jgi:hypothetical protein
VEGGFLADGQASSPTQSPQLSRGAVAPRPGITVLCKWAVRDRYIIDELDNSQETAEVERKLAPPTPARRPRSQPDRTPGSAPVQSKAVQSATAYLTAVLDRWRRSWPVLVAAVVSLAATRRPD